MEITTFFVVIILTYLYLALFICFSRRSHSYFCLKFYDIFIIQPEGEILPFISDQIYCNLKVNVAVHCFLNRKTSSKYFQPPWYKLFITCLGEQSFAHNVGVTIKNIVWHWQEIYFTVALKFQPTIYSRSTVNSEQSTRNRKLPTRKLDNLFLNYIDISLRDLIATSLNWRLWQYLTFEKRKVRSAEPSWALSAQTGGSLFGWKFVFWYDNRDGGGTEYLNMNGMLFS